MIGPSGRVASTSWPGLGLGAGLRLARLVDLLPMDCHASGMLDPEAHLVLPDFNDGEDDLVVDHEALVLHPLDDDHGGTSLLGRGHRPAPRNVPTCLDDLR